MAASAMGPAALSRLPCIGLLLTRFIAMRSSRWKDIDDFSSSGSEDDEDDKELLHDSSFSDSENEIQIRRFYCS